MHIDPIHQSVLQIASQQVTGALVSAPFRGCEVILGATGSVGLLRDTIQPMRESSKSFRRSVDENLLL